MANDKDKKLFGNSTTGFTLLEMIVYVAILALVVAIVLGLLLWVLRTQTRVAAGKELVESTQAALTIVENELAESESLYTPTITASQISLELAANTQSQPSNCQPWPESEVTENSGPTFASLQGRAWTLQRIQGEDLPETRCSPEILSSTAIALCNA